MRKQTHVLGGITAGLLTHQLGTSHLITADGAEQIVFFSSMIAGSFVGSVLPDIDHPNSFIGRRLKLTSFVISKLFGHRGITHTLLFALIIPMVISILSFYLFDGFSQSVMMFFSLGLFVGILSHLVLDAMTKSGIPLLYPLSDKPFRIGGLIKTGGKAEILVRFSLFLLCFFLSITLFV